MSKPAAVTLAIALYSGAIWFVCLVNAEAIMSDAVVGIGMAAGLYMMFFLPTAAAAAGGVARDGIADHDRPKLAAIFAVALATFLEIWFWAWQTARFHQTLMKLDVLFLVGGNVLLILLYLALTSRFKNRNMREPAG